MFIISIPNSWIETPAASNSTPSPTAQDDPATLKGAIAAGPVISATLLADAATSTPAPTISSLPQDTATLTGTLASTVAIEDSPTPTATNSPTVAPSATPTAPATATPSATPTVVETATAPPTSTATPSSTATIVATPSPTEATSIPSATTTPPVATTGSASEPPASASAGDLWINERDGAAYRFVPEGVFTMGSDLEKDESPVHEVYLDAFWVMETEVTNALYAECVAADACRSPNSSSWQDPALANHPVAEVTWAQANEYAQWAGGRLPTEAEWEKAARGADQRDFPWPNDEPGDHGANLNSNTTVAVGAFPESASPFGALDMSGNVEEWVADWYSPTYYAVSPPENPPGPAEGRFRIVRGGSFYSNRAATRTAKRDRALPNSSFENVGFRVVIPMPK
ncbi:MAG: SUMF1/EgtB/PvdO family nonheme iron enzyme [Caldilineaceae bacterium]